MMQKFDIRSIYLKKITQKKLIKRCKMVFNASWNQKNNIRLIQRERISLSTLLYTILKSPKGTLYIQPLKSVFLLNPIDFFLFFYFFLINFLTLRILPTIFTTNKFNQKFNIEFWERNILIELPFVGYLINL